MSSAMRSQTAPLNLPQKTPHQRKTLHLFYQWQPTPLHTRATRVTRCWLLQQRPLGETTSHKRPTRTLQTGVTILVKHKLLSVTTHISEVGGTKALVLFSTFPGVFITFTIVGLIALIVLTLKLFSTPHMERDCEPSSMFQSLPKA